GGGHAAVHVHGGVHRDGVRRGRGRGEQRGGGQTARLRGCLLDRRAGGRPVGDVQQGSRHGRPGVGGRHDHLHADGDGERVAAGDRSGADRHAGHGPDVRYGGRADLDGCGEPDAVRVHGRTGVHAGGGHAAGHVHGGVHRDGERRGRGPGEQRGGGQPGRLRG